MSWRQGTIILFFLSTCLSIYSQTKKNIQPVLGNSINFLDKYFSTDSSNYNIAFLAQYLALSYHRQDFHFNLGDVKPRFEDEQIVHHFYTPLIGSNNTVSLDSVFGIYKNTVGLEHIMLWGIHSDKIQLDTIAKQFLFESSLETANIRNVCHVAIAIHWAENKMDSIDQKCILPYIDIYTHLLIKKLAKKKKVDDDFMEGLVGLICLKKKKLIKPRWEKMIIEAQNKDGGWAWGPDNLISHPHTTILAYWIILELLN